MDVITVSEIKALLLKAQTYIAVSLHGLDKKILIGEINRPADPAEKKPRKRRTKKEMKEIPSKSMMDLEKEYRAERLPTLIPTVQEKDLPEDKDPFFAKVKKVKKERKKKEPVVE